MKINVKLKESVFMDTSVEMIEKINELLKEDISSQFAYNEVNAAKEGKNYFRVRNRSGKKVIVRFLYHENTDTLNYVLYRIC